MSAGLLLVAAHNRWIRDAESGRDVSHSDFELLVVSTGGIDRIRAIQLQGFSKGDLQGLKQRFAGRFLAIHAGYFFDPSDPAIALLLDDGCVLPVHGRSLARFPMTDRPAERNSAEASG